jgi:chemotaxis protein MotB
MRDRRRGTDDSQRWLTTYSDLVTLLLAFFVLLFSMSELDAAKFEQLVAGLEAPFGNPGQVDSVLPESDGLLDGVPPELTAPPVATTTTNAAESDETVDLPEVVLTPDQLLVVQDAIEQSLGASGHEGAASFRITQRGLVVSVATDDLRFESGSSRLGESGVEIVGAIAEVLARIENAVQVEGHTDDVPFGRPGFDNWDLSAERALAVLHLLVDGHELDPDRLGAVGYGEHRPLVENTDSDARALNRRVELVVLYEGVDLDE